jgi:hypothetical protein
MGNLSNGYVNFTKETKKELMGIFRICFSTQTPHIVPIISGYWSFAFGLTTFQVQNLQTSESFHDVKYDIYNQRMLTTYTETVAVASFKLVEITKHSEHLAEILQIVPLSSKRQLMVSANHILIWDEPEQKSIFVMRIPGARKIIPWTLNKEVGQKTQDFLLYANGKHRCGCGILMYIQCNPELTFLTSIKLWSYGCPLYDKHGVFDYYQQNWIVSPQFDPKRKGFWHLPTIACDDYYIHFVPLSLLDHKDSLLARNTQVHKIEGYAYHLLFLHNDQIYCCSRIYMDVYDVQDFGPSNSKTTLILRERHEYDTTNSTMFYIPQIQKCYAITMAA